MRLLLIFRERISCREFIRVDKFDSLVSPLSLSLSVSLSSFEKNLILENNAYRFLFVRSSNVIRCNSII